MQITRRKLEYRLQKLRINGYWSVVHSTWECVCLNFYTLDMKRSAFFTLLFDCNCGKCKWLVEARVFRCEMMEFIIVVKNRWQEDRKSLPIYAYREQLLDAIREHQVRHSAWYWKLVWTFICMKIKNITLRTCELLLCNLDGYTGTCNFWCGVSVVKDLY